jgi:hypothetical protein
VRVHVSIARINTLVLTPLVLAVALRLAGELFPPDQVWGHMGHAIGLSAWPWLCAFSPAWALLARWRAGRWSWAMLVAIGVMPLAGLPFGADSGRGMAVLVANVNAYTVGRADLAETLAETGARVVIEVEARAREIPGLVRVAHNFDLQVSRPSHYSAVYCHPDVRCEAAITEEFGAANMVMPLALVRIEGAVCLMGTHAPPPVPFNIAGLMPYMERIAATIAAGRMVTDWGPCRRGDPVIVAGDMNAVPGSWATRPFEGLGLSDPLAGHGIFATTWPSGGDWINLPLMQLDHLWAGVVGVGDIRLVRLPGSDHQGLFFRLQPDD